VLKRMKRGRGLTSIPELEVAMGQTAVRENTSRSPSNQKNVIETEETIGGFKPKTLDHAFISLWSIWLYSYVGFVMCQEDCILLSKNGHLRLHPLCCQSVEYGTTMNNICVNWTKLFYHDAIMDGIDGTSFGLVEY